MQDSTRAWKGPKDVRVEARVGEVVPGTVTLEAFPQVVITDEPELRDYEYVVVRDNILVVEPSTRRIIEVLE